MIVVSSPATLIKTLQARNILTEDEVRRLVDMIEPAVD